MNEEIDLSQIEGLPLLFKFLTGKNQTNEREKYDKKLVFVEAYQGYDLTQPHYKPISKIVQLNKLKND